MSRPGARPGTPPVDWLLFLCLGFFWGSSYLFIKIGVETLPPFTLIAGRLLIGTLLLGGVMVIARVPLPRDRRTYRHLVVLAIVNITIPFTLITWGEQTIDSSTAAVLNSTIPLFTIVLAALLFVDEAITVRRLAGVAIGFAGVVTILSRGFGSGTSGQLLGGLAMLGASFAYATSNVYARRNTTGLHPIVPAFFQVGIAFPVTAALALVLEEPWTITPTPGAVFSVAWLGLLGSGLAYLVYFRLIRDWGSTRTSLVAFVIPIVGILLGAAVLAESVDWRILAGTALVVAGIALVNSRRASRRLYARSNA